MALNAKKAPMAQSKGPQQEPIEAGAYPARVAQVIDLGMQEQQPYQGNPKPPAHEFMLTYELLDEFCKDEEGNELEDKPRWISETMPLNNLEVDLAKSTKRYKAIDPDCAYDGDFTQLIEDACMVTIVQNAGKGKNEGKIFNNVAGVGTMRERDKKKAPELVNPPKVFTLDEPDMEVFGSLPEWLQTKIKGNLEFEGSALEAALNGGAPANKAPAGNNEEEGEDAPW